MKKLQKMTGSKRWKFWTASVWSAMAVIWTQQFLQTRKLVQKGIFPEVLTTQDVVIQGGLAAASIFLMIAFWREWFLHDKKKNDQKQKESLK